MNNKKSLPILTTNHAPDTSGRKWWRSLEELSDSPEFQEFLHREFPANATEWVNGSRRDFIRLMGASLFLAGASGCNFKPPREKIVPSVKSTSHASPGLPLYFATAFDFAGAAIGLTVECRDGRPIKIEGNANHPSSGGATSVFAQAATLDLYDPDRARTPLDNGRPSTLQAVRAELAAVRSRLDETKGKGLRILLGASTSPTLARVLDLAMQRWPEMRWGIYESVDDAQSRAGLSIASRQETAPLVPVYDFSKADVVLSIDCDFLAARDLPPCYVRQFSDARRLADRPANNSRPSNSMIRLYYLGSTPNPTSSKADQTLMSRPAHLMPIIAQLCESIGVRQTDNQGIASLTAGEKIISKWLENVVADLKTSGRRGLVVVGCEQPSIVHALAHAVNKKLDAVGNSVTYIRSPQVRPKAPQSDLAMLKQLTSDFSEGKVETLLILGCNPVFDAPADVDFGSVISKAEFSLTLANSANDTSSLTDWLVPKCHFLESWSDARAHDGTASIVQPLISPLHESMSDIELLLALCDDTTSAYAAVRETWKDHLGESDDDPRWQNAVANGVIENTAFETVEFGSDVDVNKIAVEALNRHWESEVKPVQSVTAPNADERFDLLFRPDPTIWDGRFVNNGWLQELPKPLTHIVWDNAALMAPADAERLALTNGDMLAIGEVDTKVELPIWIVPGHAEGCITLFRGYGHTIAGRVGHGTGFNIRQLITAENTNQQLSVSVNKTQKRHSLVTTQHHQMMEGRHLARAGTLTELLSEPERPSFAHPPNPSPDATMFPDWPYEGHKWGMTIDLTACVGCSACVIACQAENNIPVVGKEQVAANRHMHWMRVDTYYTGAPQHPDHTLNQPVTCMHCERAPCEVVCPVAATNHSDEGLNQMIYNRCVGTRFCSNNCPYKVRRFNFLDYSDTFITDPTLTLLSNPDVTMRQRGVMEKCTYCVQRIEGARIASQLEERPIRDGDIKTACQSACPAQAIRFGDLNDPDSQVARTHRHPLNYALLEELNTKPRTTYLAEVKNPRT